MAGGRPLYVYPADTKVSSLPPRYRRFLALCLTYPAKTAVEIGKEIGLKRPDEQGPRILKRLSLIRKAEEYKALRQARMSLEEAKALTAGIARARDHKDQLGALKLILQMEGAFADVELPNRKKLEAQLDEMLKELAERGGEISKTKITITPRLDQVRSLPDLDKPLGQFGKAESREPIEAEVIADSEESQSQSE